jgi:hypothetical protein
VHDKDTELGGFSELLPVFRVLDELELFVNVFLEFADEVSGGSAGYEHAKMIRPNGQ